MKILWNVNSNNYETKKQKNTFQINKYADLKPANDTFTKSDNISFSGVSTLKKVIDTIDTCAYTGKKVLSEEKIDKIVEGIIDNEPEAMKEFAAQVETLPEKEKMAGELFLFATSKQKKKPYVQVLGEMAIEHKQKIFEFQKNFKKELIDTAQTLGLSDKTVAVLKSTFDRKILTNKVFDIKPHSSNRYGINTVFKQLANKNIDDSVGLRELQEKFNSTLDKRVKSISANISHWYNKYGMQPEQFIKGILHAKKASDDHMIPLSSAHSRQEYRKLNRQHNRIVASIGFNRDIKSDTPLYKLVEQHPELKITENLENYVEDLDQIPQLHALKKKNIEKAIRREYTNYKKEKDAVKKEEIQKEIERLNDKLDQKVKIDRVYNSLRHKYGTFNNFIDALKAQIKTALTPPEPKKAPVTVEIPKVVSQQEPVNLSPKTIIDSKKLAEELSSHIDNQIAKMATLSQEALPILQSQKARTSYVKKIQSLTSSIEQLERNKTRIHSEFNTKIGPLKTQYEIIKLGLRKDLSANDILSQIQHLKQTQQTKEIKFDEQIDKAKKSLDSTKEELSMFDINNLTPDGLKKIISFAKAAAEPTSELEKKLQTQLEILQNWDKSKAELIKLTDELQSKTGKSHTQASEFGFV